MIRDDVLCPGCGRAASERSIAPVHDLGKPCVVRHCTHAFHDAANELVYAATRIARNADKVRQYPSWGMGGGSQMEMQAQDRWVLEHSALLLDALQAVREFAAASSATPPLAPCEPSAEEVRPELDRLRAENRRLQDALNAGVEHVCRSFMKWRDALEANPTNGCAASVSTLDTVFLAIRKSSMLARLVYGCEPLRTVKCPAHKGKWSGLEGMDNVCPHGCQLTGWLPANDDALSRASAPPAKGDGAK